MSADRKDAARYRHLRNKSDEVPASGLDVAYWGAYSGESRRGDALDAAVDAEMVPAGESCASSECCEKSKPASADLLIERADSRIDYLAEQTTCGVKHGVEFGTLRVKVIRFLSYDGCAETTLVLADNEFSLFKGLSIAQARLLGLALSTAADEADAAATEGVTGDAQ